MEPARVTIRESMAAICAAHPKWGEIDPDRAQTLIRRMERSCHEAAIEQSIEAGIDRYFTDLRFRQIYSEFAAKVMANLDVTGSVGKEYLIDRLLSGDIDPYDVAGLSSRRLCPDAGRALRKEIKLRKKQKVPDKVSLKHVCRKCHNNKTIMMNCQTRAADELSTISLECITCGHIWRIS